MKLKSTQSYIKHLTERCRMKFGDEFVADNEELIEVAARNKRQLDRFDDELDNADLTITVLGSTTGAPKEEINPIIKHRNDIAKLYADNLEALQLTPRARYKKCDAKPPKDENDPTAEYYNSINS